MKIVFMGTPDFAKGVLEAIVESGEHEVILAITQPDRPRGRSDKMIPSPVKEYALSKNIDVMTPVKIKTKEAVDELKKYEADIFVVAAFGQILSKEILDMPRFGCVNVHASLLPKYRGAAPIQWVIADGLKETGVTIMQMNEGLDTGDILTQSKVEISDDDTGESLFDKLMSDGASLLVNTLKLIEEGKVSPIPQNDEEATYAKILKKEMGKIDFAMTAREIRNRIRAFTPWPGGYTFLNGKMLKIKACHVYEGSDLATDSSISDGTIVKSTKDELYVKCKDSVLVIDRLQPEGKKEMSAHDFLLGNKISEGCVLG